MRIGLIGAGAVGGVLAQKLYKEFEFFLIVDDKRKESYTTDGIFINGERYLFPCLKKDEAIIADVIIIAVKNYQLEEAMDEIDPFVSDKTIILSLLNGVESEEKLIQRFNSKILYSFIKGLSSVKSGNAITYSKLNSGTICFGEKNNEISESVKTVKAIFDKAGINYDIPLDILHQQWWKFMLNCCFNTLSAILLTPYCQIFENTHFLNAAKMVCLEIVKVANAESVNLTNEDIESVIALMQDLKDGGKTSMLQDMENGRRTENDYFCGTVVKLGKKYKIETPLCALLYQVLEAASYARS